MGDRNGLRNDLTSQACLLPAQLCILQPSTSYQSWQSRCLLTPDDCPALDQPRPPLDTSLHLTLLMPAVPVILSGCEAKFQTSQQAEPLTRPSMRSGVIHKEMHVSQPVELGELRQSNSDTLIGPRGNFPFQLNPSTVRHATQPCKFCRAGRSVTLTGLTTPPIFIFSTWFTHLYVFPQNSARRIQVSST